MPSVGASERCRWVERSLGVDEQRRNIARRTGPWADDDMVGLLDMGPGLDGQRRYAVVQAADYRRHTLYQHQPEDGRRRMLRISGVSVKFDALYRGVGISFSAMDSRSGPASLAQLRAEVEGRAGLRVYTLPELFRNASCRLGQLPLDVDVVRAGRILPKAALEQAGSLWSEVSEPVDEEYRTALAAYMARREGAGEEGATDSEVVTGLPSSVAPVSSGETWGPKNWVAQDVIISPAEWRKGLRVVEKFDATEFLERP